MVCKVYTRFQTKTAKYKGIPFPGRVLSARSKGLRLDESWLYTKSLLTLRVISVKFLLVITLLYKTEWSWELRTWSHKMNLIDTSTNSPHFFYWKRIGITNENLNLMLGFKGLRSQRLLWGFLIKRIVLLFSVSGVKLLFKEESGVDQNDIYYKLTNNLLVTNPGPWVYTIQCHIRWQHYITIGSIPVN